MKLLICYILLVVNLQACCGFVKTPFRPKTTGSSSSSSLSSTPGVNLTGDFISNLAEIALKLRLKGQTGVSCQVTSKSPADLLQGKIGPVTVKGRGWVSRLGLTCRAIEATVGQCDLDLQRILAAQKLVLTQPARGKAMIALDAKDFLNFITHPQMNRAGGDIQFVKDSDHVSINTDESTISFRCKYKNEGEWQLGLSPSAKQSVEATASPVDDDDDEAKSLELAKALQSFFLQMVFELDGTFLTFTDMMITGGAGGKPALALLQLDITVHKFPAPGAEF